MGRAPCCDDQESLKKGAWTAEEDEKLVSFIRKHKGHGSWRTLPKLAGLERCGKSCRLRWTNYLRPNIKRGNFTSEEERIIIQLHALMGNKWSTIASHLAGRTDNEVKNHWNTHLRKRLAKMGIDPTTHLPFLLPAANYYTLLSAHQASYSNTDDWRSALLQRSLQVDPTIAGHLVQWELARLEAEARLQLAAASSRDQYIQHYASWLQRCGELQQNQNPAYNLNDLIASISQPQAATTPPSSSNSVQIQSVEDGNDHHFLKQLNPATNEGNHCLPSLNFFNSSSTSSLISEGLQQLDLACSKGLSYTSASSIAATPETCSSETTSHLVCDQLQLPDDDLGFITTAAADMSCRNMSAPLNSPLLTSPSRDDLHDSYWNNMLNLLGHVTFDQNS